jgi:hypothetical protein
MPDTIPTWPRTAPGGGPAHPAPGSDAALLADVADTARNLASLTARLNAGLPGDPAADDRRRGLSAARPARLQRLQALEDAITYRRIRISTPCPECPPGGPWCDDHACDLMLIAAYQRTAHAALLETPSPAGPPA